MGDVENSKRVLLLYRQILFSNVDIEIHPGIEERFIEECEARSDDPEETIERLLTEYVFEQDFQSEVLNRLPEDSQTENTTEVATDYGENDDYVHSIGEYDVDDDKFIHKDALRQLGRFDLVHLPDIDRADIDYYNLPGSVSAKQSIVVCIAQYENRFITEADIVEIVEDVYGDNSSAYNREKYVAPVVESLIPFLRHSPSYVVSIQDLRDRLTDENPSASRVNEVTREAFYDGLSVAQEEELNALREDYDLCLL